VDALGIVLHDVVLRHIVGPGYYLAFSVACAAKDGDIHLIGTRAGICIMQDVVVTMTFLAAGCIWVVHQQGLTVDAPYVVGHLLGMAIAAVYRLQIVGMGETLIGCIAMARETGIAVMNR
jgi:hypothetical protein